MIPNNDKSHVSKRVGLDDFCMQIDSHMDFSDNYDTELIFMHHRTQNDYAVVSTYVAAIDQNNQNIRVVPNLCMVTFTSTIANWGTKECLNIVRPKLTNAMWGAGLSFHRCHAEINVPVDPYLDNVFDGEEGSRGIRFFTHGYDVYAPDVVLVTHDYKGHQGNPVVHTWGAGRRATEYESSWDFTKEVEQERHLLKIFGKDRVNKMLGIGPKLDTVGDTEIERMRSSRFGLGTKRSLEQVKEFTGIDLENRRMEKNKCGNLFWVPFSESENYGVDEFLQRGNTGPAALTHEKEQKPDNEKVVKKETTKTATAAVLDDVEKPMKANPIVAGGVRGSATSESEKEFVGLKKGRDLRPADESIGLKFKHAEERFVEELSYAEGKAVQQLSNVEESILHPNTTLKKAIIFVAFVLFILKLTKKSSKKKSHKHKK
mmetsp:Transcript_17853/g.25853  ORF Transcript_17853/g.25853 Transcript_17853/m.25853 type:complete len:430 (-) Transcript_17853:2923-4212(-)